MDRSKIRSLTVSQPIFKIYDLLFQALGPSCWWPGEDPFEIAIGAILTQNTNWSNVEKAILNLKRADLLTPQKLFSLPEPELAQYIRPSGFFKLKAKRLKNFLLFLKQTVNLNFEQLRQFETGKLRTMLLQVNGIGPETADSILLYALEKPIFVIDAYTKRIFTRHHLLPKNASYEQFQKFFMQNLPLDVKLFNEYHALIVRTAKSWCLRTKPLCEQCPLKDV